MRRADHVASLMKIDVIVVNFNSGAHLSRCVQSVLTSTITARIFVVDNHSSDESLSLLKGAFGNDSHCHIVENAENLGFARANNLALPETTGDYILFLNPDCFIQPDTLERLCTIMADHPEAGMGGCLIRNPDGSEQEGCRRNTPTPLRSLRQVVNRTGAGRHYPGSRGINLAGRPLPDRPSAVEAISGAFMLVRRKALEQVGPMDEGYFLHCEDLDWCMRFRMAGWQILFVPDIETFHNKGACSSGRPVRVEWHKHRGMIRFYRKFFRTRYPAALMYLVVVAVWFRFCLVALFLSVKRISSFAQGSRSI